MYHHNDVNGLKSAGNPAYFTPPTYLRDEIHTTPLQHTFRVKHINKQQQGIPLPHSVGMKGINKTLHGIPLPHTLGMKDHNTFLHLIPLPHMLGRKDIKHIPVYQTPATYIRDNDPGYISRGWTYCRTAPLEDILHGHYVAGTSATLTHVPHHMT